MILTPLWQLPNQGERTVWHAYEPSSLTELHDSLLTHLKEHLCTEPTPHTIFLTVLESQAKRTNTIFPHTPNPPKASQQEYLVTLSIDVDPVWENDKVENAESSETTNPSVNAEGKRVLLTAISAYLYKFPTTNTSILYISKIDSSGYSPNSTKHLTRKCVIGFISYFCLTLPGKVNCQLFARSQNQYLFANSFEGGGKKVLGGLGLCKWWKGVYEDVAISVEEKSSTSNLVLKTGDEGIYLGYLLPSYSAEEAFGMLGTSTRQLPSNIHWKYEPPFKTSFIHPASNSTSTESLANLIPALPDDPKTRFLESLIEEGNSGPSKRHTKITKPIKTKEGTQLSVDSIKERKRKEEALIDENERQHSAAVLSKTSTNEFWEQMGYRQECSSGDVTGFFTLSVSHNNDKRVQSGQELEQTDSDMKSILRTALSIPIMERLLTALLNTDFKSRALAIEGTQIWESSVRSIVSDELGSSEVFDEYCSTLIKGVYGSGGEKRVREEVVVTMLQPRKKKK